MSTFSKYLLVNDQGLGRWCWAMLAGFYSLALLPCRIGTPEKPRPVLGMIANVFSVKLCRMFLNVREIEMTWENKRSRLFQRIVGDSSIGETPREELFTLSGGVLR